MLLEREETARDEDDDETRERTRERTPSTTLWSSWRTRVGKGVCKAQFDAPLLSREFQQRLLWRIGPGVPWSYDLASFSGEALSPRRAVQLLHTT